jgi:hypothetical protein
MPKDDWLPVRHKDKARRIAREKSEWAGGTRAHAPEADDPLETEWYEQAESLRLDIFRNGLARLEAFVACLSEAHRESSKRLPPGVLYFLKQLEATWRKCLDSVRTASPERWREVATAHKFALAAAWVELIRVAKQKRVLRKLLATLGISLLRRDET